jgi:hypothetical protein
LVDRQTYRDFLVYRGPVFRAQVMPSRHRDGVFLFGRALFRKRPVVAVGSGRRRRLPGHQLVDAIDRVTFCDLAADTRLDLIERGNALQGFRGAFALARS